MDSKNHNLRVGIIYKLETDQNAIYTGLDNSGQYYTFEWTNPLGNKIPLIKSKSSIINNPPIPFDGSEVYNDGQTGGRKTRKTRKTRKNKTESRNKSTK